MIDWPQLEQLYAASKSDNPKIRATAQTAIDGNIDKWVSEFVADVAAACGWSAPTGKVPIHKPLHSRFTDYDELELCTLAWLDHLHGEAKEEFDARRERLEGDKLRVLLTAYLWEKARAIRRHDYQIAEILGEYFGLSVWWGDDRNHKVRVAEYHKWCEAMLAERYQSSASI